MPSRGVVLTRSQYSHLATSSTYSTGLWSIQQGVFFLGHSHDASLVGGALDDAVNLGHSLPPLRLLVIGDSLAAGVGMSQSSTPALPEAIAAALSRYHCGRRHDNHDDTALTHCPPSYSRVVYWTCVGTPGLSSAELVLEIKQLVQQQQQQAKILLATVAAAAQHSQTSAPPPRIIRTVQQWQRRTRYGLGQWWRETRKPVLLKKDNNDTTRPLPRNEWVIQQRWQRLVAKVSRDAALWNELVVNGQIPDEPEQPSAESDVAKQYLFDTNEYDIAVVLTGLNDLKETFLPFMVSPERAQILKEARKLEPGEDNGGDNMPGLQGELVRVIKALKSTMRLSLPAEFGSMVRRRLSNASLEEQDICLPTPTIPVHQTAGVNKRHAPLVVLPALPLIPTELSHRAPLSWFLVPIIRAMDRNKQILAEKFPQLVLFVEQPSAEIIVEAEAKRGPLWLEDDDQETLSNDSSSSSRNSLLKLTNAAASVRERIEGMMRVHYSSLVQDREDDIATSTLYELCGDDVFLSCQADHAPHRLRRHPGSSLVSADGIHPNDLGYKIFGRHIANAIIERWEKEQES